MEVFILKTNLTSEGKNPDVYGVYDSYSLALRGKEELLEQYQNKVGDKEHVTESAEGGSSELTFVYSKDLNGPIYWYSISKKELKQDPETWIVTSESTKEFGVFTSREQAEKEIKKVCSLYYNKELTDNELKSSVIYIFMNNGGFDNKKSLHVETFTIKKVELNKFNKI
jgi:hypothetical protein